MKTGEELTQAYANQPHISVVVPVFNEAGNVTALDTEIKAAVGGLTDNFEIIYINDDSSDGSLAELKALSGVTTGVTIINMNRRYGQATALDAGFKAARGEFVVSMDGDGQNDPADIPAMLKKLQDENLDVVCGWRKTRRDKQGIRILTRIGQVFRKVMIGNGVHDFGCTLRVMRLEAAKSLDIGGEMHRYIVAILRGKGFRVGEVVVNDRLRQHGVSKYNYQKALRGFIDLIHVAFIDKYAQRPLHLFGGMGLASFAFGMAAFFWTVYGKLAWGLSLNRNGWALVSGFLLLGGIVCFSVGFILDLLIRTHLTLSPHEHRYYVREVIRK